jgi:hypothetical protein
MVSSLNDNDNKSFNVDVCSNVENVKDDKSDFDLSSAINSNNLQENEKILENIDDIFDRINNNDNEDAKSNEGRRHNQSMFNIDHSKLLENVIKILKKVRRE